MYIEFNYLICFSFVACLSRITQEVVYLKKLFIHVKNNEDTCPTIIFLAPKMKISPANK